MTDTGWLDRLEQEAAAATAGDVLRLIHELRAADARPVLPRKLLIDYRVAKDQADRQRARADALAATVARIAAVLDDAPHTDVFTLDAAIRNALNGSTR